MNDTAISWHRRLYARRGWGGLLLGLTAVGFVGAGSAEATDDGDYADYVVWRKSSATPDGRELVVTIKD